MSAPDVVADARSLPPRLASLGVVDAHAHVFPPRVFEAVWRWFDRYGWPVRYRLHAKETIRFLVERGVEHVIGLHYAHVPGLARDLNRFASDLAREEPRLVACATILPGEDDARAILDDALGPLGLRGIKIHCHVQKLAPDDPRLDDVYDAARAHDVPVVIHAGNAPSSPHYGCDIESLCTADRIDRALARHPRTTILVPHLGAARVKETAALLDRHERLLLDTTMTLGGYVPHGTTFRVEPGRDFGAMLDEAEAIIRKWPGRVLYGSDFPNLPYEWDRELKAIAAMRLPDDVLSAFVSGNARRVFRIE